MKYLICHICANCVGLCEKNVGKNFELSRYMWRKYEQRQMKFILGAVYIYPNVPQQAI
jgi:hypothetical protein